MAVHTGGNESLPALIVNTYRDKIKSSWRVSFLDPESVEGNIDMYSFMIGRTV